jgi:hypothetical protein
LAFFGVRIRATRSSEYCGKWIEIMLSKRKGILGLGRMRCKIHVLPLEVAKIEGSHISGKSKSLIHRQILTFPLQTRIASSARYSKHNPYHDYSLSSANIPPFHGPASCCFIQNKLSFWNGSSVNLRLGCASIVVGAALEMPAFKSPHTFCSSGWC